MRIGTKVVAVAASAFVLAGCFSPGAKYGGPPAGFNAPDASPRLAAVDAGPVGRDTSPADIYGTPPPPTKPKP